MNGPIKMSLPSINITIKYALCARKNNANENNIVDFVNFVVINFN